MAARLASPVVPIADPPTQPSVAGVAATATPADGSATAFGLLIGALAAAGFQPDGSIAIESAATQAGRSTLRPQPASAVNEPAFARPQAAIPRAEVRHRSPAGAADTDPSMQPPAPGVAAIAATADWPAKALGLPIGAPPAAGPRPDGSIAIETAAIQAGTSELPAQPASTANERAPARPQAAIRHAEVRHGRPTHHAATDPGPQGAAAPLLPIGGPVAAVPPIPMAPNTRAATGPQHGADLAASGGVAVATDRGGKAPTGPTQGSAEGEAASPAPSVQMPAVPTSSPASPSQAHVPALVSPDPLFIAAPGAASATAPVAPQDGQVAPPHHPVSSQVAPVVVSLARAPTGLHHVTIRLAPPELGGVQIRLDHAAGTPARVEISVQRPETLALLVRDMPQLQHALHQAGVIVDAGSMVVQLDMQPPQTASGDPDTGRGRDARTEAATGQHVAEPEDEPAAMTAPVWLRAGLDITA